MGDDEVGLAPSPSPADAPPLARAGDADALHRRHAAPSGKPFVLGLMVVFAFLSFLVFRPFMSYVFMGAVFVYLMHPVYRWFLGQFKSPTVAAASVLYFATALVLTPLIWVTFEVVETIGSFAGDAGDLQGRFTGAVDAIVGSLQNVFPFIPGLNQEGLGAALVAGAGAQVEAWLRANSSDALAFAGNASLGVVVMLFVLYYGLKDGARLVDYLKDASPLDRTSAGELVEEVRRTVDAVFLGHIIVSVIQGALGGLGFLIFGVPNVFFWTFIMIVASLVPVLGAFIIWMPAAVWLLSTGETFGGIGLLVWGLLIVSTVDNILRPKIVGARADIHPVLVLVGVLGGLSAFGLIGFVLGPLALAMLVATINFWRHHYDPPDGGPVVARAPPEGPPLEPPGGEPAAASDAAAPQSKTTT